MNWKQMMLSAVSLSLLLLAGCDDGDNGSAGDPGIQGPAGMNGANGMDGASGADGMNGNDGMNGADGMDGADGVDATPTTISLSFLGRFESGLFDESAAEIVDFDPATQQVFVVNANSGQVDILDASSPSTPTLTTSLNVAADVATAMNMDADDLGGVNSLAISNMTLAVAIEADIKQNNGFIAFYQTDGTFLSAVEAGALPDMVTFTPDGNTVLAANEGEPNGDYSVDPEGSVTVVDVSGGAASVTQNEVTQIDFRAFNRYDENLIVALSESESESEGESGRELTGPVRIAAKADSVAADLEPEFIAISPDSTKAYVILQENNAVAVIDLMTNTVDDIFGIGFKNHSIPGNELDTSDRDNGVNIRNVPVFGTLMPDGADAFEFDGVTLIVTANEGDAREYLTDAQNEEDCAEQGGFDFDDGDCLHYLDEIRIKDITDTGATFDEDLVDLAGDDFEDDNKLGRLKVLTDLGVSGPCSSLATTGQPGADCTYEALFAFGGRSFTIWNPETGQPIFDSGNQFEVITANRLGENFNASNDDNDGDDRSDDKGPEPEAVEIAVIEGRTYAFIGLERVGGIMVYNITTPEASEFVQYINPRDFSVGDVEDDLALVGDLGPESIKFVSAANSPTGNPLLIVGNEVSGTTSFFNISIINQ